jgi:sec-independent protein translocase protein TatA
MTPVLGEILGWEALLVLGILALLFGSSQLPKLARSIGSAKGEFERGLRTPLEPEPGAGDAASTSSPTGRTDG